MKEYLKSKTIRSAILVGVIVVLQIVGVGDPEAAQTIDQIADMEGGQVGEIMRILQLLGLGGVAYGRRVAKGPLGNGAKGLKGEKGGADDETD